MNCDYELIGMCLTKARDGGPSIFGFPDFLTALALLALAFSSSDALYRFKIEIAPLPLRRIAFFASVIIGSGSLATDLWFAASWYSLPWGWSRAGIQAGLGALFLSVILIWLWFAFVARTDFNRFNYKRFHGAFYRGMVRGSIVELTVLAEQLPASAESLIRLTAPPFDGSERNSETAVTPLQRYAHDVLWLLGNRKFCRVLMASSPHTAIVIMAEATRQGRYDLPLVTFVQNLTLEGVLNTDSQIYHEDRNSMTSIFGYIQPFSSAVYGNYELLEKIGGGMTSSLDLDWQSYRQFSSTQWEAYLRITLITIESYAVAGRIQMRSYLLSRAIDHIKNVSSEIYQLNGAVGSVYKSDALAKISAGISFVRDALTALDKADGLEALQARFPEPGYYGQGTILDDLTDLLYQIILDVSGVEGPPDLSWTIYYNTVWSPLFNFGGRGPARALVLFKLRRRLFDEIKRLEEFPNFEGARILAFTLNVIGFRYDTTSTIDRPWLPLGKATARWTQRNYLALRRANLRVADACLIGRVTFDEENSKIVKTYVQGLHAEPPRALLDLDPLNN